MVDLHATWYYFAMKPKKPSQDRACDIPTNTTRRVKQQHLVFIVNKIMKDVGLNVQKMFPTQKHVQLCMKYSRSIFNLRC